MTATAYERAGARRTREAADNVDDFAVEVTSLNVSFGTYHAVRNLSMRVPRGSIYGLVGPGGSGKTTTLRTLAALQQPSAGTVLVDGVDARSDPKAVRERVGYLPDFSGMYEALSVHEYLDFYAGVYRIPRRRRRALIGDLLELVGLTEKASEPIQRLSPSMRRQLGLARCLIHDPGILLLDEPASGMDPRARLELRDILRELARFGKTVLIGSHMLSEIGAVCTQFGVMRAGEIVLEAPVEEIVSSVPGHTRLRVRVLGAGDREAARRVLEAHPSSREIESQDGSVLRATFAGTEEDLAAVWRELCAAGVQITELAVERPTLEDVLLQLTETDEA